ncbi:MAG: DUF1800 domain-containing protein [Limisphaerales bacterium]
MLKTLPASQWNYRAAAHLLGRAGFGGTPNDIQKLAKLGPDGAVDHLVDYEKTPDTPTAPGWARPDPDRLKKFQALRGASMEQRREMQRANQETQRDHLLDLREWWLKRMVAGPRPLQEKLTLFWHGHFATSVVKVRDACLMWRQNETFRHFASGNWLQMLVEISKDPAMLIWLDQAQSRKEHPNENYAREVMELFTLGEGHYTEQDVTEGARALTGWSYDRVRQEFVSRPRFHDDGEKTFLGRTGCLTGMDALDQIVAQPQAARFITAKLWTFFASENPSDEIVSALADEFRHAGNNFKPVLRTMFRSEAFYADAVVGSQVKSPVQWLVGSCRLLGRDVPPGLSLTVGLRQLGQDLFAPPNVKGWDGGISWITTNNLLNRYNYAALLVMGRNAVPALAAVRNNPRAKFLRARLVQANRPQPPIEVTRIIGDEDRHNPDTLIAALEKRFLLVKFRDRQAAALREFLETRKQLDDPAVLNAIRLVMSTPEYQLT